MSYTNFSEHAPTGESKKQIVTPNIYSTRGQDIGFPNKFDVYVNKLHGRDGVVSVTESRTTADLVGNRLYLYHRPAINSDGSLTSISSSHGTIDTSFTSAKQGYIVFSVKPTSDFTVSYLAVEDDISPDHFNRIQDSIMEIEGVLGVSELTGYPGVRNLAYGIFDTPLDSNLSGVLGRAVYLSHLDRDIVISSTDESSLTGSRGIAHDIQLGREDDTVTIDVTGLYIGQSNGTKYVDIQLGDKTGDFITYMGALSGEGQLTIGGPEWPGYSGAFGGDVSGDFYDTAMARINGDMAVLGDLKTVGSITVVNLTGEVSTVIGDFTITDELTVQGETHLIGPTDTNRLDVKKNIYLDGNLISDNVNGAGGGGQTLIDNLDPSEVAHTYTYVTKKTHRNMVLDGRPLLSTREPKESIVRFAGELSGEYLVGDSWAYTGFATATAGPSGAHPNIVQMNFTDDPLPKVTGKFGAGGLENGIASPGMLDPGSLWIEDLDTGFKSPTYGYTIESGDSNHIYKINLFCPELQSSNRVQTNDSLIIYNPGSRPYDYISTAGGASPTFSVFASSTYPFAVAFDDQVSVMTSSSSTISMSTALDRSITGLSLDATGQAYIFAKKPDDPENPPTFSARNIPFGMPGEVGIGEVTAVSNGSVWSIEDTTSYRPGAVYDSAWIPMDTALGLSGRVVGGFTSSEVTGFFEHDLGCDVDIYNINAELYLGTLGTATPNTWDAAQPLSDMFMTRGARTPFGFSGAFTKVPLTNTKYDGSVTSARDASLSYIDGKVVGIVFDNAILQGIPPESINLNYLRLIIRRDA